MIIDRRKLLRGGAAVLLGAVAPPWRVGRGEGGASPRTGVVEIRMVSDPDGARVGFDPVGVLVAPGTTIRWRLISNVHTATAYHPEYGRPLRIPSAARPWDSGYLIEPGATFEVRLDVEGVYDYFCRPHEQAGMVGRTIVGRPGGPGAAPPAGPIPPAARRAFPPIEGILRAGVVPLPRRR